VQLHTCMIDMISYFKLELIVIGCGGVVVFNATFNNISVILNYHWCQLQYAELYYKDKHIKILYLYLATRHLSNLDKHC